MMDLIHELWRLERHLVSDGYDEALARLAREVPMAIHEYPTGTRCWTWTVPEKWTCHEAYLETLDGHRLIDHRDHPLHVVSYSLPFDGIVSREELLAHLHVHPGRPEAIPFVFKYYQRDWGLCATRALLDRLTDESYRVVIRTSFEPGTLKVGEVVVPGDRKETVVLAAHLCHPAMVNDDLSGVVVGIDVCRALLAGPRPSHTYRLLIGPETIGSVAYLSHHEELIPTMVGGLFLEMLAGPQRHALQRSLLTDSRFDRCLTAAFADLEAGAHVGAYRTVINNDERQFNAPGVRVPMLSLSRVDPTSLPFRPFPEYHSSDDDPTIASQQRLEASRDLALSLLGAWENDAYIVNLFKGEVFCSGHGIWVDYRTNPQGHRELFAIMERCDGGRTVSDIAAELGIGFRAVAEVVGMLEQRGLVRRSPQPQPTDSRRSDGRRGPSTGKRVPPRWVEADHPRPSEPA